MKTNHLFKLGLLMVAAFALAITGCQKDPVDPPPDENGSTSVQQISQDDNHLQKIDDDINLDIEIMMTGGGLKSTTWLPCNATIDSANVVNDTVTYYITYHGLNCPETLYRTGKVEVKKHVGTQWYMPGATVLVKIINLQITRVATQKTITINGVKTHKNVTGGLLVQLGYGINTIVHRTHGFMTVNFDDGTNRTWNIARRIVYTGTLGSFVIGVDGFGQVGEYTNLVTWGVARNGDQFYISVPQPVHYVQACNFNPVNGIQSIDIPSADKGATLTFGFDSNNQPVVPPACPTKYKLDWYHGQNSGTIFLWL
ncbi:MAG: hypothetical protein HQ542_10725 [Bacteroidia bacterium]|nr:hypothetical protein [Bacteroidia bacterium]